MRLFFFSTVLFLLLGQIVMAQVSPPDGARLHTSNDRVTLRWQGSPSETHFLQVYASGRQMFSDNVKGNSITIPLPPGPRYQWKVSKSSGGGYTELGSYTFQLSGNLSFHFDGQDGASGQSARDGWDQSAGIGSESQLSGSNGSTGQPGQPGSDITVTLKKDGDYISVAVLGRSNPENFLLDPASAPILISTTGGHGGAGGRGGDGAAGYLATAVGNRVPFVYPPGAGGDGGVGGSGGNGGNVTVLATDVSAERYVQVRNEGGLGGEGGGPGRGGPTLTTAAVPVNFVGADLRPGPPGRPGAPGRDGVPGQVDYR
jgi:hypothetical protein